MPSRNTRGVTSTNGRPITRGDVIEAISALRNELVGDNSFKSLVEERFNSIHARLSEFDARIDKAEVEHTTLRLDYEKQKSTLKAWAAAISFAASVAFRFVTSLFK